MRARNGLFLAVTILWTGCQESELSDDDSAFLDDDDAMEPGGQIDADSILDFGDVYVGESSELTVEIRNTGVQPLLVSAALLAGGSEDFSIVFESEVSIVAETSIYLPLEVTFAPSEAKAHSSSLILLTSAFNVEPTAPFAVELSGNGLQDDDGDGHPWGEDYHGPDADCDDANGDVHPQAEELCDGIDNNCDGGVDNRADEDGDGATLCDDYPDCDDTDGMVHPAWVDPDAVGGLGTRAQPFSSMIDALESENCGQVLLTSGVYYEGEVVEIESGPLEVVSVDGHLAAEVSGGGNTPLFSVAGGPATFIDVLFQDGYASNSAGAVHATAAVAFEGCSFAYNRSDTGAGAVRVDDADLVVDGCQFLMNEGTNGGAVAAWSSDDQTVEHISIRETDFVGNAAQYGGGVYAAGVNVEMEYTDFVLNEASYGSGAILLEADSVFLDGCAFQGNSGPTDADSGAGGLGLLEVVQATITASLFDQNESSYAGGLYIGSSSVQVLDSSFKNNHGSDAGGGIGVEAGLIAVDGCTFSNNISEGAGGAIDLATDSLGDVYRSSFVANVAGTGGAIYQHNAGLTLTNAIFNGNQGDGAAVYFDSDDLTVNHATILDNRSPEDSV